MTARNYALVRNHIVENIIVLDDAAPNDPHFALWLTQFDAVTEVSQLAQVTNPGQGVSPGWKRPGAGQPFAPLPGLFIDGQPLLTDVTIAADGAQHTVTYWNPQADAPASATITVALASGQVVATKTVAFDPDHVVVATFNAPKSPATLAATAGGLTVTVRAV